MVRPQPHVPRSRARYRLFLDLSLFLTFNALAFKRLIGRTFIQRELSPLIEAIFLNKDENDMVGSLCGDEVQTFVDVIDEVRFTLFLIVECGQLNQHQRYVGAGPVGPFATDAQEMYQIVVQDLSLPRTSSKSFADPILL